MSDNEVWITAAQLKRLVPLAMRYSLNQRLRERAGFGLLRLRLKAAYLSGSGPRERVTDYLVPDRFLEATSTGPSRAHIDVEGDKFRSKYPARLTGIGRDQVVEGIGLMFEAQSVADAFGLDAEPATSARLSTPAPDMSIAPLLSSAKPSVRKNKPYADEVAKLVREGASVAEAIRQVRPQDPRRQDESIDRGIRACFDLHYRPDGRPLT